MTGIAITGQKPSEFDTATKNALKTALGILSTDELKTALGFPSKVKRYMAILERPFSNDLFSALGAHVLNADDADYLGDLTFDSSNGNGMYFINGYPWPWPQMGDDYRLVYYTRDVDFKNSNGDSRHFHCQLTQGQMMMGFHDDLFNPYLIEEPFPIEIVAVVRGEPAILLSAELPESGDKFILTFDKPISQFRLREALSIGGIMGSNGIPLFYDYTINGNDLELLIDTNTYPFNANTECSVNISAETSMGTGFYLEARDFGKVIPVLNFPVTNKMST